LMVSKSSFPVANAPQILEATTSHPPVLFRHFIELLSQPLLLARIFVRFRCRTDLVKPCQALGKSVLNTHTHYIGQWRCFLLPKVKAIANT
jgi:hypothetical protein